jgi:hypothetical protein
MFFVLINLLLGVIKYVKVEVNDVILDWHTKWNLTIIKIYIDFKYNKNKLQYNISYYRIILFKFKQTKNGWLEYLSVKNTQLYSYKAGKVIQSFGSWLFLKGKSKYNRNRNTEYNTIYKLLVLIGKDLTSK